MKEEQSFPAESLCPVCLALLPAEIQVRGREALLSRVCPEHGPFQELIWRGPPAFTAWRRPRSPVAGIKRQKARQRGCPLDCGLCPEHRQHPCTVLLEITSRCNLRCPVCFAASGGEEAFPTLETLAAQLCWIRGQAGEVVLQLSGGEPTLHPRLAEIVAEAARLFPAVQLNTNGLRLAEEPELALRLAQSGLSWVFLQFDGVSDRVFNILRGRPLLDKKLAAVEACAQASLPVILVPTLAAGVNSGELGELLRLAVSLPIVRGLHLQPMTFSGRNALSGPEYRLTLPETLRLLEEQGAGQVRAEHALPPGCEHERCSFHLRYRRLDKARLLPRPGLDPLCAPGCACNAALPNVPHAPAAPDVAETREENSHRAVRIILKSWKAPDGGIPLPMAAPDAGRKAEDNAPPCDARSECAAYAEHDAFDEFLERAQKESFSITCMAFQDARNLELERLRNCCVQVFRPPDALIPFCAMNLSAADGRPLYRAGTSA